MDAEYIFFTITILIIIFYLIWNYLQSDEYNLKCIIATNDGHKYCVQERKNKKAAAKLLSKVIDNCKQIIKYMEKTHPDDIRTKRLIERFKADKIKETLPNSELTAYSENKGEKIAFCLNKKKNPNSRLIDLNTLTFVALHELSHLMTKSIGHKQEFWENFKFLLINAKQSGVYNPQDYKNNPTEYCGEEINDNPYFDLV